MAVFAVVTMNHIIRDKVQSWHTAAQKHGFCFPTTTTLSLNLAAETRCKIYYVPAPLATPAQAFGLAFCGG